MSIWATAAPLADQRNDSNTVSLRPETRRAFLEAAMDGLVEIFLFFGVLFYFFNFR